MAEPQEVSVEVAQKIVARYSRFVGPSVEERRVYDLSHTVVQLHERLADAQLRVTLLKTGIDPDDLDRAVQGVDWLLEDVRDA